MPETKLPAGSPGSISATTQAAMPSITRPEEHPEVWINGEHFEWKLGEEDTVPTEALAVWNAYLEANR